MFFSIIIPTYNREKKISQAIQSILYQSFIDYEILIIDDGSSDDTEKVIKSISQNNIHYYKTENFGVAHARNQGILKAKGQYIGFLDSDDLYEKNHLQSAHNLIQSLNNPEVVHLNFAWGKADQSIKHKNKLPLQLPNDLFNSCSLHVNCLFIRQDIAKTNRFNEDRDLVSAEDWDLFLKLAIRYKIHLLDQTTSYLIDHEDRSTRKINNEKWVKVKDSFLKSLKADALMQEKYAHKLPIVEAHMNSLIALNFVLQKNKAQGFKMWTNAIRLNPAELFTKRSAAIIKHIFLK